MFISYSSLAKGPVMCRVGNADVSFELTHPGSDVCFLRLDTNHQFWNGDFSCATSSQTIQVGTEFEIEYKDTVRRMLIGRQFLIRDM